MVGSAMPDHPTPEMVLACGMPCVEGSRYLKKEGIRNNVLTTAITSAIPSLIPPHVQALFGDPPLLRGEDDGLYHMLMEHFTKLVEPKDMIE